MTDTTDIKALRERMMQQREAALTGNTPSFEDCELLVCDLLRTLTLSNKQIEAERQRADEVRVGLESEISHSNRCIAKINTLEAELAALKGDQVPVAAAHKLLGEVQLEVLKGLKHHKGWQPRCGWVWGNTARTLKIMDALLKKDLVSKGMNELFQINKNGLAAIEAAGGIVKDGE